MKVVFKNGDIIHFNADDLDFTDVETGKVLLMNGNERIGNLNWKNVLFIYDGEDKKYANFTN